MLERYKKFELASNISRQNIFINKIAIWLSNLLDEMIKTVYKKTKKAKIKLNTLRPFLDPKIASAINLDFAKPQDKKNQNKENDSNNLLINI